MKWKEFLKSEWKKILLIGIGLTFLSLIRSESVKMLDYAGGDMGFPLFWLHITAVTIGGFVNKWDINWSNLLLDLIFWFIISFFIVWIFDKVKKK